MAVPTRKTSHARKSSRRSTVWKLNAPTLTTCPNCGELMRNPLFENDGRQENNFCSPFCLIGRS